MIREPGSGWTIPAGSKVGRAVWDGPGGIRIHVGGSVCLETGEILHTHQRPDAWHLAQRMQPVSRRRAVMVWALMLGER